MKKILVTGGAGYIGSFMVRRLLDDGHGVTILDNLEKGYEYAIDKRAIFKRGDTKDTAFLEDIFSKNSFDGVMHFAAYISVEESTKDPQKYFNNNVKGTENLVKAMMAGNINTFIFSSTAAVYGNPVQVPIPEEHPKSPVNPYGKTKLEAEAFIESKGKDGLNFVCLRYFNAAGASLNGDLGENHNPETHIIPNAIRAVLEGREFNLYGTDYKTPDGTAVRDYIHVLDLIEAHILALKKIEKEEGGFFYNVGTGKGHSNKEVLDMIQKVSSQEITITAKERRTGDAEVLVADPSKIQKDLGFSPKYSDIETIIKTAWKWHSKNTKFDSPNGGQNSK